MLCYRIFSRRFVLLPKHRRNINSLNPDQRSTGGYPFIAGVVLVLWLLACMPMQSAYAQQIFNFKITAQPGSMLVEWDAETADIGVFRIERTIGTRTNLNTRWEVIAWTGAGAIPGVRSFSFTDGPVLGAEDYCYRVAPQHINGTLLLSFNNSSCARSLHCPSLPPPVNMVVNSPPLTGATFTGDVDIDWDPVPGAIRYTITWVRDGGVIIVGNFFPPTTSFTWTPWPNLSGSGTLRLNAIDGNNCVIATRQIGNVIVNDNAGGGTGGGPVGPTCFDPLDKAIQIWPKTITTHSRYMGISPAIQIHNVALLISDWENMNSLSIDVYGLAGNFECTPSPGPGVILKGNNFCVIGMWKSGSKHVEIRLTGVDFQSAFGASNNSQGSFTLEVTHDPNTQCVNLLIPVAECYAIGIAVSP